MIMIMILKSLPQIFGSESQISLIIFSLTLCRQMNPNRLWAAFLKKRTWKYFQNYLFMMWKSLLKGLTIGLSDLFVLEFSH